MQAPLADAPAPGTIKPEDCPNRAAHTEGPAGYIAWHNWAERNGKTHTQRRCPGCNRFTIWERK
jgi:hypothetical protein